MEAWWVHSQWIFLWVRAITFYSQCPSLPRCNGKSSSGGGGDGRGGVQILLVVSRHGNLGPLGLYTDLTLLQFIYTLVKPYKVFDWYFCTESIFRLRHLVVKFDQGNWKVCLSSFWHNVPLSCYHTWLGKVWIFASYQLKNKDFLWHEKWRPKEKDQALASHVHIMDIFTSRLDLSRNVSCCEAFTVYRSWVKVFILSVFCFICSSAAEYSLSLAFLRSFKHWKQKQFIV